MMWGEVMYIPLCVKSDHSLLKSMIKIDDLITFLKDNNITACGLNDDNLFGAIEFYNKCLKNNIKPILGLTLKLDKKPIYLYAKNYNGYQELLKLNTIIQQREINVIDLEKNSLNVICVISYSNSNLYNSLINIYKDVFIGYANNYEKNNALIITKNIVFFQEIKALTLQDISYLKYLTMIENNTNIQNLINENYEKNYYLLDVDLDDIKSTQDFANLIDIKIPKHKNYIPKYKIADDSFEYLYALTKKGLLKRLNNEKKLEYFQRLNYELNVIKEMGFVDYFLIVYDYVLFAKKNDILVGPGRGSAAGCLVAYSLGITDIDPLKYDLLFERFLNKDRVTMPDIDIDFEDTKRGKVIDYLKEKYGKDKVANIMTYATLGTKQVLRDVAKILNIPEEKFNQIFKHIDSKKSLLMNYQQNKNIQNALKNDQELKKFYQISLKLEGLKRQVSTHAAGVIISNEKLDNIIPIIYNDENILTGCTMEYLEDLGLIKMDLLAIKNLRVIKDVLDLIYNITGKKIKLADIPLNDLSTLKMFEKGKTEGVFQFESEGMKNFLKKLKPSSFEDIIAAIALFRPGPMENIDEFIKRKEGKTKISYVHESLEDILKNTYGIIVYQEQIMQILVKMANYTYAEADNIRRAMSKKKIDIMEKERKIFIKKALKNNYQEKCASDVYDLIIKFANYGFNKSHSVAYALIGYQMAYLKTHFPLIFYANLLNMSISSEIKTKEYLYILKQANIEILGPQINTSSNIYKIKDKSLLLPLGLIKNIGENTVSEIINERKNGPYIDFLDFVKRTYGKGITKKVIESLIYAGAFKEFSMTKKTLVNNIDNAITYAELTDKIDSPLILKPTLEEYEEYNDLELINFEKEVLGFYITNHPASKFQDKKIIKLRNISLYFDKYIKCVVLVTKIHSIKTKKNETMCFITGEDETGSLDFVIFPNKNVLLTKFKNEDIILVTGRVEKRIDKYQVVVSNIEKVK